MTTRGVLYVHSAPRALCPHVEWAVAGVLGTRVNLDWIRQPAAPGTWRSEFSWQGQAGTEIPLTLVREGTPLHVVVRSADRTDYFRKPSLQ